MSLRQFTLGCLGFMTALVVFVEDVSAQNVSPSGRRPYVPRSLQTYRRPTYSPYLNLLRNNNTVFNYYGLVRPELEFRSANSQFRQDFRRINRRFDTSREQATTSSQLGTSGHAARFMTNLRGGAGGLSARGGTTQQQPGTLIGPTGHGAYFGNHGIYYLNPQQ